VSDLVWQLSPSWDTSEGRAWCAVLPATVAALPDSAVIHRGRNTLWRTAALGRAVVIKRFGLPRSRLGRLALRLRGSKAQRSMSAARRLAERGFATPEPLAAVDVRSRASVADCYYCCADQPCRSSLAGARDDVALAFDVGGFVARLHARRIQHRDLNATNVLLVDAAGDARFSLIDLNRVRFGRVGTVRGLLNLQTLGYQGAARAALIDGYHAERRRAPRWLMRSLDAALGRMWRAWWFLKSTSRPLRRRLGR